MRDIFSANFPRLKKSTQLEKVEHLGKSNPRPRRQNEEK
jgi:hypothetical protein